MRWDEAKYSLRMVLQSGAKCKGQASRSHGNPTGTEGTLRLLRPDTRREPLSPPQAIHPCTTTDSELVERARPYEGYRACTVFGTPTRDSGNF
eukprot:1195823-Prorocentrum_minimum.AAC.14